MAREDLKFFPLECRPDEKLKLIEAEFGLKGFAIVVKLLQKVYGEHGYYCEWSQDASLLFASQVGISDGEGTKGYMGFLGSAGDTSLSGCPKNLIDIVVAASIRRGIFDRGLYEKFGILTSKDIQAKYLNATRRFARVEVKKDYLLINDDKIRSHVYIIGESVYANEENVYANSRSKVKYISSICNAREGDEQQAGREDQQGYGQGHNRELVACYVENIDPMPNQISIDALAYWEERLPAPVIMMAIREAVLQNRRSMKYVEGILRNWSDKGLNTEDLVSGHLAEWKGKKDKDVKATEARQDAKARNKFADFPQRERGEGYYEDLERHLLKRNED